LLLLVGAGCDGELAISDPSLNEDEGMADPSRVAQSAGVVPGQFIGKLYTEGLGRAPDPGGWRAHAGLFQSGGCSPGTLETAARSILSSIELQSLGLSDEARILVLYRALLGREPDPQGYATHLSDYRSHRDWTRKIDHFLRSPEFLSRIPAACSGHPTYWGRNAALELPIDQTTCYRINSQPERCWAMPRTQSSLQTLLDTVGAGGGGVVRLPRRAVIRLTSALTVPVGVTLATRDVANHRRYAEMARLVRVTDLPQGFLVRLAAGSVLRGVWVDGQHGKIAVTGGRDEGVRVAGPGAVVEHCRLSDSEGTAVYLAAAPYDAGVSTDGAQVRQNLITGYANRHMKEVTDWSDGVTNRSPSATIEGNHIVDVTDVGVITFHPGGPAPQRSVVRGNRILALGNPMVAAIGLDPETGFQGVGPTVHDFTGFLAEGNEIWTGGQSHLDIVLSLGTRAWFADGWAVGGTVRNNTSAGNEVVANNVILIASMSALQSVTGNTFAATLRASSGCLLGNVLAAKDSSSLGQVTHPFTWVDTASVTACVSHRYDH
jgi:hypothetical protein